MRPMNCDFRAYEVCTNFRPGLLQWGDEPELSRQTWLLFIHIMQHHLSDSFDTVWPFVDYVIYYESSLKTAF